MAGGKSTTGGWVVLHGGALGDLALTIQLALRLTAGTGAVRGPDAPHAAGHSDIDGRCRARPLQGEAADGLDIDGRCAPRGTSCARPLHVVSRVDIGDLSACRPAIARISSETVGLHWLFAEHDEPPPERLRALLGGARVLSALGGTHTLVHHRLQELKPDVLYSLDPRPAPGAERHITQQWQTQLEAQGLLVPKCIHQRPAHWALGVPDALRQRGRALLADAGAREPCVLIHPGSGGRAKCWPWPCFAELGRRLSAPLSAAACFVLGPAEQELWPRELLADMDREFTVVRGPSPADLCALLAGARVFVGNDAGPTHLAALLGTRTVVLFGPTSASIWRPLGTVVDLLSGDPAAAGGDWGIRPQRVAELVCDHL